MGTSGFYMVDGTVSTLPLNCHPISFQVMGDTIWTRRQYSMSNLPWPASPPPGITIRNDIQFKTHPLCIDCDASLNPGLNVATCAWVIKADTGPYQYFGKLEGIYHSLQHIQTLTLDPPRIQQWCNTKAAIDNAAKTLATPSQMTRPDADILLAISALCLKYSLCVITQTHVYGHQDTWPVRQLPDLPSTTSFSSLDSAILMLTWMRSTGLDSRQLNIKQLNCRHCCLWRYTRLLPYYLHHFPPYPGSKALLRIGKTWITSHVNKHIAHAAHSTTIWEYCLKKYDWNISTFNSIYWEGIGRARQCGTHTNLTYAYQ